MYPAMVGSVFKVMMVMIVMMMMMRWDDDFVVMVKCIVGGRAYFSHQAVTDELSSPHFVSACPATIPERCL
jgi:hypothetical protein